MKFITAVIILMSFLVYPLALFSSSDIVEDCVTKTERINKSNESYYLVFAENEVYKNEDSFIRFKFNSSDFYRDIKEEECYEFTVQGWRIPFLSMYRNIYKLDSIK